MATFSIDDFNRFKTIDKNSAKMRQTLNSIPVKMNQIGALEKANNFAKAQAANIPANLALQQENFAKANSHTDMAKQPTVLAKLKTTGSKLMPSSGGMVSKLVGGLGLATSGVNMVNNGVNLDNATDAAVSAGLMTKNPMIAGGATALGLGKFIGSNLLPESVQIMLAETLTDSKMPEKQVTTPEFDKYAALLSQKESGKDLQNDAGKDLTGEVDANSKFYDEIDSGNLTGSPDELGIKLKAARGEISEEDAIKMLSELGKKPVQQNDGLAGQSNPKIDPLAEIRNTIAKAQEAQDSIVNPLQQENKIDLKNYSNNPFAAVMQLQRVAGQTGQYAIDNKQAKDRSKELLDSASKQAGLVELENTLKNSSIAQEKGQLELAQSKRLNDAMTKLGTLDDKADPKGDKRKALQETILTMLGKEPKDNYQMLEVGGGVDEKGLPLPKRVVVFDKSTGKPVYDAGGGEAGATTTQTKPKMGAIKNVAGKNYEYRTSADGTGWHNDNGDLIENV
jgi:hypothetical protein